MIKVLPDEIAEKISAGEVVENPASVVKELVENSIDAGATAITIETKQGGRTYIRITDNGSGMTKEDCDKCFLRHATSKIGSLSDLYNISTMGFRGEALYAISAVSEITVTTKTETTEAATITRTGDKIFSDSIASHPVGTTIEVRNLFFNTPARLKFLKSDKYEQIAINNVIQKLALVHTAISFKLISDGVVKIATNGRGDLVQTVYSLFGDVYAKNIKQISHDEGGIRVEGCIGGIATHKRSRIEQFSFVNSRYIKSTMVSKAVEEAHKDHLMHGNHPFFVINIIVNPSEVDINIHPQKLEAKFSHNGEVYKAIYWAVLNTITAISQKAPMPAESYEPAVEPIVTPVNNVTIAARSSENIPIFQSNPFELQVAENDNAAQVAMPYIPERAAVIEKEQKTQYRLIGQVFGTYILVEKEDKFVMIDQHAADERRLYDKLTADEKPQTQLVMNGWQYTFSDQEKQTLLDNASVLESVGFEIEDFGENAVIVRTAPSNFSNSEIKEILEDYATELKVATGLSHDKIRDRLHYVACKSAVKGNNYNLTSYEMTKICDWVFLQSDWQTCPHGRPVMKEYSKKDLEKAFKRIV